MCVEWPNIALKINPPHNFSSIIEFVFYDCDISFNIYCINYGELSECQFELSFSLNVPTDICLM